VFLQKPLQQVSANAHSVVQFPQYSSDVSVFVHVPLQQVSPAADPQFTPQSPQLRTSVSMFLHVPEQHFSPAPHGARQFTHS
jgi:hypothetical protein